MMKNSPMLRPRAGAPEGGFFRDLFDLRRDFDSLFESALGAGREADTAGGWWPSLDSFAKDGKLHVRLDLPGIDPGEVDVSLLGNQLAIRGERRAEEGDGDAGYREIRYGRFERTVTVPDGIDPDQIEARYADGVLDVTLPLPEEKKGRKVPIEIESKSPEKAA